MKVAILSSGGKTEILAITTIFPFRGRGNQMSLSQFLVRKTVPSAELPSAYSHPHNDVDKGRIRPLAEFRHNDLTSHTRNVVH